MYSFADAKIVHGAENPSETMRLFETIGRISHLSGESKSDESAGKFVRMLVRLGHESVLEHSSVTVLVECDRAMAQQWTRHRLAAYTMESQRYVNYKSISFIDPEFRDTVDSAVTDEFHKSCAAAAVQYQKLREAGAPPEDARAVLPNCTKTTFYTTANLRAWRHIFLMRCAPGAQHNIRRVMTSLLSEFYSAFPDVFYDLAEKFL